MSNRTHSHEHRQRQLVDHVVRYGITTPAAVAGDMALSVEAVPEAKRILSEFVKSGVLGQAPLYRKRSYCYLTRHTADSLRNPTRQDAHAPSFGPLSETAKIRAYAMLAFCCLSSEQRVRLTREQFKGGMPHLYRTGMPMSYYVARRSGRPVIGFLRVDVAGRGRWDRIVQKVRHDIQLHWQNSGFRTLIQSETFEVAVVTTTTAKCQRLQQSFADERQRYPVPLRIVAIPEIIHLLAPPATPPSTRA